MYGPIAVGVERGVKPTVEVFAGTFHMHLGDHTTRKLPDFKHEVTPRFVCKREILNSHSQELALEALLAGGRSGARAAPRLGHGAPAKIRLSIIRCKGCDFVHEPIVRALVR